MNNQNLKAVAVTPGDFILNNMVSRWVREGSLDVEQYLGVSQAPNPEVVECWLDDPEHFWSVEGMQRLVQRVCRNGVNRIYWRTFGGGNAYYSSELTSCRRLEFHPVLTRHLNIADELGDFSKLDFLPAVIDEAHRLGVEIYAWYPGCEEDHGARGKLGDFAAKHPHLCQENRFGEKLPGNLSLAFEETRAYKRQLVDEMLGFDFDGILLDCTRDNGGFGTWKVDHPLIRNGERKVPSGGYEEPVREAFMKEFGADPRRLVEGSEAYEMWWLYKSRFYPTPLVEICSDIAKNRDQNVEVLVHLENNLETYGLDIAHWIDEEWIDAVLPVMPGHHYPGATHGYYLDEVSPLVSKFQYMRMKFRDRVPFRWTNYQYPLGAVLGYQGDIRHPAKGIPCIKPPGPLAEVMRGRYKAAQAAGSSGYVAFEADHLENLGLWADTFPDQV